MPTPSALALVLAAASVALALPAAADHTATVVEYYGGSWEWSTNHGGLAVCQGPPGALPWGVGGGCYLDVAAGAQSARLAVLDDVWESEMYFFYEGYDDALAPCGVSGEALGSATVAVGACAHVSVWPDVTGTHGYISIA